MRAALLLVGVAACADQAPAALQCGDPVTYRIDRLDLPDRSGEGTALGMDLDGDGNVDNALGFSLAGIHSALSDAGSFDASATAHVSTDVTWLVTLTDCNDGQHVEIGQGGGDEVPISVFGDLAGGFAPVAWTRAAHVQTNLLVSGDELTGVIAFVMPMPDDARPLVTPFAGLLTALLPTGSTFAAKFDHDHDGVVTIDEVLDDDLTITLLAPDLKFPDGVTGLSAGMGIHATRVAP